MLPNLKCLLLEMIYGSLTFDLLDIELFQRVRWLRILRYLLEIETNLMSEFKFLEFIEINILNLEVGMVLLRFCEKKRNANAFRVSVFQKLSKNSFGYVKKVN
jgi:hypothetical protein